MQVLALEPTQTHLEVPSVPSELSPLYLGVVGLNPFPGYISSPRLAMFCGHIGQSLVVEGSTINRLSTGVAREYAKNIHDVRFPCNSKVLKIIHKYPETLGADSVKENPLTTIIYENSESDLREVGILNLERFHCIHQYFGFRYKHREEIRMVQPDACIPKDTIIATSPSITEHGDYKYGLGAQVAMMSVPPVIEDGIIVSKSFAKRCTTKGYGIRTVSWGRNAMPLNLYGNDDIYKIFPEIGEHVAPSGLLFASRGFEEHLAVPLLSKKALQTLDFFDKPVYATPGAKIVDIIVLKGNKEKSYLPSGMDEQCRSYHRRARAYYGHILGEYFRLKKNAERMGKAFAISPEFHRLVVEAMAIQQQGDGRNYVVPTYGRQPLDEWMVQIIFEYDIVPTIGFKLTGMHGDKGVICDVWEDEDMPLDASGNRAEIIMDSQSTIKRMNPSRLYEQYINASGRATAMQLKAMAAVSSIQQMWEYLLGFYSIVSPRMYNAVKKYVVTEREIRHHIETVVKDGHYLHMPTDNPVCMVDVVRALEQHYPAVNGPVSYRGRSGRMVTTKKNIIIGEMYMLVLEKIGNTWNSVSSAKLQLFGIPAKMGPGDKYSTPGRHNPVRILGESEGRLVAAVCGGDVVADILDQTNNPVAHRMIVENILHAETPTAIDTVLDRSLVPRGKGKVLTMVKHNLACAGVRFVTGDSHAHH